MTGKDKVGKRSMCFPICGRESKVSLGARGASIGSHRLRHSRSLFVFSFLFFFVTAPRRFR
ncbi:hypothetical protein BJX68DRAFT_244363 [Aspergillus pseudodeflectus]|uniref:Uncharacterized protein n=1 Tax=Aspergillus pseudodeflectus TaxID=176178 RepID=A0ABR4JS22_9EURO